MRHVIRWSVLVLAAAPVGCKALGEHHKESVVTSAGAFASAGAQQDSEAKQRAAAKLAAAVAEAPKSVRPIVARALELRQLGQVDAAIAELNKGLKAHPKSPDLHHHLARCESVKARDRGLTGPQRLAWLNKAVQSWEKALAADPKFYKAAYNLGVITYNYAANAKPGDQAKLYEEARQYWLGALAAKPDFAHAQYNLGVLAHAQEKWLEAQKAYQATLKANPKHSKARSNLGIVRFHLAKTNDAGIKAAVAEWRKILAYAPTDVYAQFNLGRAEAALERWDGAIAYWRGAAEGAADGEEQRFLQSRAWFCLAVVYDQYQPDPKRCLEAIRKAYNMYTTNREYRHMLRSVERRHGM
jgi:tetratricopeptide (TPR) repeat protein